ncbi:MAG TPA: AAA family ATPase [Promineifilum sp.]|nr:AAA family ATPase [Promineifilum sp.]
MLLYLFGLPAAGKNYVGQVLADTFGYTFYDGDLDLTEELRDAVRQERPFTDTMRDRFYAVLIERIAALRREYTDLAFGQATFKERHRALVAEAFPDVVFVLVEAAEEVRLARLARGGNPVTVDYARQIAAFFEPPRHAHFVIRNEGGRAEIVAQLERLLATLAVAGYV